MVMVGLFGGSAPWSLPLIPMKAATIQGTYTGNLAETRELAGSRALRARRRRFRSTRVRSRRRLPTLEDMKAGRIVGRVVLTP